MTIDEKDKLLEYLINEVESAWASEGIWFDDWDEKQREEINKLINKYRKEK